MVDLVYLCSNNSATPVGADFVARVRASSSGDRGAQSQRRRAWVHLRVAEREEVARRYESGDSSSVLASEYGVAKSTILGILRSNGTAVRRQSLSNEEIAEASSLYEGGLSLSQAAKRLDVNQETMRTAMIGAGVVMRPAS